MITIIINILSLAFLNTLALVGIMLLDVIVEYWEKRGDIQFNSAFITVGLLLILLTSNFLLLYCNNISQYKWSVKKKMLAGGILLLGLSIGLLLTKAGILEINFIMRPIISLIELIAR